MQELYCSLRDRTTGGDDNRNNNENEAGNKNKASAIHMKGQSVQITITDRDANEALNVFGDQQHRRDMCLSVHKSKYVGLIINELRKV